MQQVLVFTLSKSEADRIFINKFKCFHCFLNSSLHKSFRPAQAALVAFAAESTLSKALLFKL